MKYEGRKAERLQASPYPRIVGYTLHPSEESPAPQLGRRVPQSLIAQMNCEKDVDSGYLQEKLQAITAEILNLASSLQGDNLGLLELLRALEHSHRDIRDNLFQASLPDNRQALYALLKDIEEAGGWPYIDRMKLQLLLCNFPEHSMYVEEALGDGQQQRP